MYLLQVLYSPQFQGLIDNPFHFRCGILLWALGTGVPVLPTAVALILHLCKGELWGFFLLVVPSQFLLVVLVSLFLSCFLGLGIVI